MHHARAHGNTTLFLRTYRFLLPVVLTPVEFANCCCGGMMIHECLPVSLYSTQNQSRWQFDFQLPEEEGHWLLDGQSLMIVVQAAFRTVALM